MKKLMLLMAAVLMAVLPLAARDKIYRSASALPQKSQEILKKNFKADVNRVKVDDSLFGGKDYEVVLSDGTEIDFDSDGDWKEVDCGHRAVPKFFIIAPIQTFVSKNHKGATIVKIDKNRNDYEIELADGTEIKFDRSGDFQRYDD